MMFVNPLHCALRICTLLEGDVLNVVVTRPVSFCRLEDLSNLEILDVGENLLTYIPERYSPTT